MIVYRDIISGDEMITDAYKLLPVVDSEGKASKEIGASPGLSPR